MKAFEEIKKGLECCWSGKGCIECPYNEGHLCNSAERNNDALAYIQQLESRLAQVERERAAAVQLAHGLCHHCKNVDKGETCRKCLYYPHSFVYGTGDKYVDNWEWRGVCQENSK